MTPRPHAFDTPRWRRATRSLSVAILPLVAAACVPSLQPLYTEDDLVIDDRILGNWIEQEEDGDSGGRWTFERQSESTYRLTQVPAELPFESSGTAPLPGRFDAHLVELEGALFLDLTPQEQELGNDLLTMHLLPVHTFWKVTFEEDGLKLRYLDPEWLEPRIESGSISIRHETIYDAIVLSASTEELQRLMIALSSEPEAFSDPLVLRPMTAP